MLQTSLFYFSFPLSSLFISVEKENAKGEGKKNSFGSQPTLLSLPLTFPAGPTRTRSSPPYPFARSYPPRNDDVAFALPSAALADAPSPFPCHLLSFPAIKPSPGPPKPSPYPPLPPPRAANLFSPLPHLALSLHHRSSQQNAADELDAMAARDDT